MKVQQLFEATDWRDVPQVRVSNIYPGNPLYKDLLALTSKDEIEKVKRKSLLTNVKKRFKGASFIVVGKTNTDDVYFRICKSDIKESAVSEAAEEQEYEVETSNGFDKQLSKIKAKSSSEAREKIRDKLGYGHYVIRVLLNGEQVKITEAVKGKWKIQNLMGVMKSFNDNESADAKAWMSNRGDEYQKWDGLRWIATKNSPEEKAIRRDAKYDAIDQRDEKAHEKKRKGLHLTQNDYQRIYDNFSMNFGDSFPDGDPFDSTASFIARKYPEIQRYEIGAVIDRALAKCGQGVEKKGRDAYLTVTWEDMMWDSLHDVDSEVGRGKSLEDAIGVVGNGRTFFYVQDDKLKIADNPWSKPADRAKRLADAKKRYKNIPFA